MTTRSIVTSQPDVACDVCARRLLRGEQPDTFIAAGRRLTVCELCAPRAAHEGWKRETDQTDVSLPPLRPRRGRSFFQRLLSLGAPAGSEPGEPEHGVEPPRPYDLYEESSIETDGAAGTPDPAAPPALGHPGADHASSADPQRDDLARALDAFNASEYPRRIAGVARSLGPPVVNVRPAEHLHSIVNIVVAWELCWYRYAVDLDEEHPVATATHQGTELEELPREEREGNAAASDSGTLGLAR